jgi:hypothetical protein
MKLDEIEKLIAEATPGPWEHNGEGGYVAFFEVLNDKVGNYISAPNSGGLNPSAPDAAFIAASRSLMPKLLKVVKEAEAMVKRMDYFYCDDYETALADLEQP